MSDAMIDYCEWLGDFDARMDRLVSGDMAEHKIFTMWCRMTHLDQTVKAESEGVAGWHKNGEIATWEEVGL